MSELENTAGTVVQQVNTIGPCFEEEAVKKFRASLRGELLLPALGPDYRRRGTHRDAPSAANGNRQQARRRFRGGRDLRLPVDCRIDSLCKDPVVRAVRVVSSRTGGNRRGRLSSASLIGAA